MKFYYFILLVAVICYCQYPEPAHCEFDAAALLVRVEKEVGDLLRKFRDDIGSTIDEESIALFKGELEAQLKKYVQEIERCVEIGKSEKAVLVADIEALKEGAIQMLKETKKGSFADFDDEHVEDLVSNIVTNVKSALSKLTGFKIFKDAKGDKVFIQFKNQVEFDIKHNKKLYKNDKAKNIVGLQGMEVKKYVEATIKQMAAKLFENMDLTGESLYSYITNREAVLASLDSLVRDFKHTVVVSMLSLKVPSDVVAQFFTTNHTFLTSKGRFLMTAAQMPDATEIGNYDAKLKDIDALKAESESKSSWYIIGGVGAGIIVIILLLIFCCCRRKKKNSQ